MSPAQNSHHEHRRVQRKRADFTTEVTNVITRRSIGHLGDLSSGGLMLISPQPPRENAIYQLRLTLSIPGMPAQPIEVGVQSLWYRTAAQPGKLWAGYRIIAISDDDIELLHDWLTPPG